MVEQKKSSSILWAFQHTKHVVHVEDLAAATTIKEMNNLRSMEKGERNYTYQCSFISADNATIWCPMIRPWPRFANLDDNERLDG